jgi:Ca2+/Na+ antiporter
VQSKVLDMLNYLGISNTMMKTVEQRDFIDKIILFTCMVFTVVLLFALWWFVKYI